MADRPMPEILSEMLNILIDRARQPHRPETIGYGEIAKQLKLPVTSGPGLGQYVARYLNPIAAFCLATGLPPLIALVVNVNTKKPGEAFYDWYPDHQAAISSIANHYWTEPIPRFPKRHIPLSSERRTPSG